ncbi:MAG: hypothetical protein ACRDSP_06470 [Pseudonocardiaceae bacterium]
MTIVDASFDQLRRLTDDTGLLEHAMGAVPRRQHGYCLDDVARGLVVVCRQQAPADDLAELTAHYLAFMAHAQATDGRFHNRLGYDRQWQDLPGLGDWWGRALWGLGTAAVRGRDSWIRAAALACFDTSAHHRPPSVRSMAFAALGAAEVLTTQPDHHLAMTLLADSASLIAGPRPHTEWYWPEHRLHYANAVLPEVLIAAGNALDDKRLLDEGLELLGWLLATETFDGHLSPTPVGGWRIGEPRPAFDQQPLEAAAIADACTRAFQLTGDRRWIDGVRLAVGWFLGDNDARTPMHDPRTGGGYDGLEPHGRNENQGAESTLALISTLQHSRQLVREIR